MRIRPCCTACTSRCSKAALPLLLAAAKRAKEATPAAALRKRAQAPSAQTLRLRALLLLLLDVTPQVKQGGLRRGSPRREAPAHMRRQHARGRSQGISSSVMPPSLGSNSRTCAAPAGLLPTSLASRASFPAARLFQSPQTGTPRVAQRTEHASCGRQGTSSSLHTPLSTAVASPRRHRLPPLALPGVAAPGGAQLPSAKMHQAAALPCGATRLGAVGAQSRLVIDAVAYARGARRVQVLAVRVLPRHHADHGRHGLRDSRVIAGRPPVAGRRRKVHVRGPAWCTSAVRYALQGARTLRKHGSQRSAALPCRTGHHARQGQAADHNAHFASLRPVPAQS